jgi:hypothetical protein
VTSSSFEYRGLAQNSYAFHPRYFQLPSRPLGVPNLKVAKALELEHAIAFTGLNEFVPIARLAGYDVARP